MRRARRAAAAGSRHISLSAMDAEWEVVRRNADRRGLSIARYLVGLVERDGSEGRVDLALVRGEQRELLEAVREIRALLLGDAVPGGAGPAEAEAEVPGHDADGERLRWEIRFWPARAKALLANRTGLLMYEPPGLTAAAGNWRVEARDLLDEAKALGHGIARRDLAAHLNADGAEPDAIAELAARIRAMLARDEEARAAMPGSYPAGDPE